MVETVDSIELFKSDWEGRTDATVIVLNATWRWSSGISEFLTVLNVLHNNTCPHSQTQRTHLKGPSSALAKLDLEW